jgi:alpha-1,3-glucosyltransferase
MMYGVMMLSIAYILEGKYMASAAAYAVLLNFKHIYLYSAPAFGIFYVRQLILKNEIEPVQKVKNFLQLAIQTIAITLVSFGPFLLQPNPVEQLKQIGSRLFPFDRGLVHSYMAANAWELKVFYNKFIVNLYTRLKTKNHVAFEFPYTSDSDTQFYKKLSMVLTVCFLLVSVFHPA